MKWTLGRSSCPPHAEHCVTWNTRGWSGSSSSSTCFSFVAVSCRYDVVSCWSCRSVQPSSALCKPSTRYAHHMYFVRRLPDSAQQPLFHKSNTCHTVPAEHLYDHQRWHQRLVLY